MSKLPLKDSKTFKSTSLQLWSEMTDKYFHRKLRIEDRKDREYIYKLLNEMKVPTEGYRVIKDLSQLTPDEFTEKVSELGFPYWLSATPKLGVIGLNRLTFLNNNDIQSGWKLLQSIQAKEGYKLIIMQYVTKVVFKGSALISKQLNGIADFVLGDSHFQLTAGKSLGDPLLFNKNGIVRYSTVVRKKYQDLLWHLISRYRGHFEFEYGDLAGKEGLYVFDYNDEPAYEDIDKLFDDLLDYYSLNGIKSDKQTIVGLPASLGKKYGKVRLILSSEFNSQSTFHEGEVLVTDATNPDMTPLMKKTSAIVTDLGGVTSHAAIVCREMKIPCVVGTKIATQKLKNGDLVLVDAYQGIVKIEKES